MISRLPKDGFPLVCIILVCSRAPFHAHSLFFTSQALGVIPNLITSFKNNRSDDYITGQILLYFFRLSQAISNQNDVAAMEEFGFTEALSLLVQQLVSSAKDPSTIVQQYVFSIFVFSRSVVFSSCVSLLVP
jgi:hypothetical protein